MKLCNEMEKAFLELEKRFDTHSLEKFLDCPYQNLSEYYDELGLWIRNHLLTNDCPLMEYFTDGNVLEKKDMSIFMIQSFYIYIHQRIIIRDFVNKGNLDVRRLIFFFKGTYDIFC